ncbi:NACHT domain-containing NTPase [Amycolatopsis sp. MtRt-6]|uniref:NACHT domain-containing protein n=1 Tax=Amycolatopsis sp. MtRt-6 TaxID=2792782 RepID=UPI001A8CE56C|nr:NACHT domain-containing protein [Amycolatopsis sp. MtRt-6]
MPGFEEALVGRLLGQAAKPVLHGVRHALARRGYGRTDIYMALGRLSLNPTTLSILAQIPAGITQRDIKAVLDSPNGIEIFKRIIALQLEANSRRKTGGEEDVAIAPETGAKIKKSLAFLIRSQVAARYKTDQHQSMKFQEVRFDQLEAYTSDLFELLAERGKAWAEALVRSLRTPERALDWAFRTLIRSQLEGIDQYLEVISRSVEPGIVDFANWKRAYRKVFESRHSTIQLPQVERRLVPHEQLFVRGEFQPWSPSAHNLTSGSRVEFEGFFKFINKAVVLGDPGAGKSTTSTLLARQSFGFGMVPFIVRLRNIQVGLDGFSVESVIEEILRNRYQAGAPTGAVRRILTEGKAFLVFDGLDELIDSAAREAAAQTIDAIAALYPFVRIVVTSRRVGYSVARLNPELFDEFVISSFSQDQVGEYAQRWFSLTHESDDMPIAGVVRKFLELSRPIADLRTNPLMLAFICILYQEHGSIPHRRAEIFRQCVDLFLYRWDGKRRFGGRPNNLDLVEVALSYVAYAVLTDRHYQDGVTEKEVFELVVDPLLAEGVPDRRGALAVTRQLLELCRGRAWIFANVDDGPRQEETFSFTHASFMEYFAALYVDRTMDTPEEIVQLIAPQISAGRWEILAQVCISLRLRSKKAGAARIMEQILVRAESIVQARQGSTFRPVPSLNDEDVSLVEFLLRASETMPMASDVLRRLMDISIDHFALGRSNGLSALLNSDYQYVDAAYEKLIETLSAAIDSLAKVPGRAAQARAWIATHFGYMAGQPLIHHVDFDRLSGARTKMVSDHYINLPMSPRSVLIKSIRLHAGGALDARHSRSFVELFEGCHSPIMSFGPRSTVEWIVDCMSAPFRASLPASAAIKLLRQIPSANFVDNDLPIGGEAHQISRQAIEKACGIAVAHDDPTFAGWSLLAMAVHELWEIDANASREEILDIGEMLRFFRYAKDREIKRIVDVDSWLKGLWNIWKHPAVGSAS